MNVRVRFPQECELHFRPSSSNSGVREGEWVETQPWLDTNSGVGRCATLINTVETHDMTHDSPKRTITFHLPRIKILYLPQRWNFNHIKAYNLHCTLTDMLFSKLECYARIRLYMHDRLFSPSRWSQWPCRNFYCVSVRRLAAPPALNKNNNMNHSSCPCLSSGGESGNCQSWLQKEHQGTCSRNQIR